MNAHARIVSNLEGRIHDVNVWTAIHGLDMTEGLAALRELMAGGRVVRREQRNPYGRGTLEYFRLAPTLSRPRLAVDSTQKGS